MFRTILLSVVVALALANPAFAQRPRDWNALQEAGRTIEGGRSVLVTVAQPEIAGAITPSNVTGAMGGGLIGAMIDTSIQARRASNAEVGITPIRATLFDFDVDEMAIQTSRAVTDRLPWFQPQTLTFSRDSSPYALNAALDAAPTSQVAFFEYAYDITPDFGTLRVSVVISLANKAQGSLRQPEQRLLARNLAYHQSITSWVQLPNPTTPEENALRWAANDGALVRLALTTAFAQVAELAPRAMQMTGAELQAAAQAARTTNARHPRARVIEEGPSGALLYDGGLVHVQTISE